jgi:hypothetical protein
MTQPTEPVAFVKENIRDIVFGSSSNQLFSFGNEIVQNPEIEKDTFIFEEFKITKYLFTERSGLFCKEKSIEEIQSQFEEIQQELTTEYKRKHKHAHKRQKKMRL